MPNRKIINKLKKHKKEIIKKYNLFSIGLFGSYARGDEKPESDVDVLVKYKDTPDMFELIQLEIELENKLKKKIDLLEVNSIRNELSEQILNEVIYIWLSESRNYLLKIYNIN